MKNFILNQTCNLLQGVNLVALSIAEVSAVAKTNILHKSFGQDATEAYNETYSKSFDKLDWAAKKLSRKKKNKASKTEYSVFKDGEFVPIK